MSKRDKRFEDLKDLLSWLWWVIVACVATFLVLFAIFRPFYWDANSCAVRFILETEIAVHDRHFYDEGVNDRTKMLRITRDLQRNYAQFEGRDYSADVDDFIRDYRKHLDQQERALLYGEFDGAFFAERRRGITRELERLVGKHEGQCRIFDLELK